MGWKKLLLLGMLFAVAAKAGAVNINTAGVERLAAELIGVGPVLATRIVRYRQDHGPFKRPEDIQNVPYIGTKTFEKNRAHIRTSDP